MPSKFLIGERTGFLFLQRSETQIFWSNGRDTILAETDFQIICELLSCLGDVSALRVSVTENRFTQVCTYGPDCTGQGGLCCGVTSPGVAAPY